MFTIEISSLLRHVKSEKLYKWPTLAFVILTFTSPLIDFIFFCGNIRGGIVEGKHILFQRFYQLHAISAIIQVTLVKLAMA